MSSSMLLVIGAYLIGSVSSAIIVCSLMGLPDPRKSGSYNPGATNVLRLGGKRAAAITLSGDLLKGLLPVLCARLLNASELTLAMVALAAFLGHLYPVFFQFRGGKGVATAFGAIVGISWLVGGAILLTWLCVALISRISSLSAIIAALLTPAFIAVLYSAETHWLLWTSGIISSLLLWRHRSNIQNLIAHKEKKFGK